MTAINAQDDEAVMHLLRSARMVLDRVAQGHDERLAAEGLANRIVDVTGHDVTDEPPHLLVAASDLIAYTDAHRMTVTDCVVCTGSSCYEEWAVLRDDLRNLIAAWGMFDNGHAETTPDPPGNGSDDQGGAA